MTDVLSSPVKFGLENNPAPVAGRSPGDDRPDLLIDLEHMLASTANEDDNVPAATLAELEALTERDEAVKDIGGAVLSAEDLESKRLWIKRNDERGFWGKVGKLRVVKEVIGKTALGQAMGRAFERIAPVADTDSRNRAYARIYRNIEGENVSSNTLRKAPRKELREASGIETSRRFALVVGSRVTFDIPDAHLLGTEITQAAYARFTQQHGEVSDISPTQVGEYLRVLDDLLQSRKTRVGDVIYDPKTTDGIVDVWIRAATLIDKVHTARREYDTLTLRERHRKYHNVPEGQSSRQSLLEYLDASRPTTRPIPVMGAAPAPQRAIPRSPALSPELRPAVPREPRRLPRDTSRPAAASPDRGRSPRDGRLSSDVDEDGFLRQFARTTTEELRTGPVRRPHHARRGSHHAIDAARSPRSAARLRGAEDRRRSGPVPNRATYASAA